MGKERASESRPNRWKGYFIGQCGGLAGVCAMNTFMRATADYFQKNGGEATGQPEKSMSLVGRQHREDEGATQAVGRILYTKVAGREPQSPELKSTLSQLVHWGYGMEMGGCYGFFRTNSGFLDLNGGLKYGTGLWLAGDELALPMLGLAGAPQSKPAATHVQALIAHLVYGAATAATISVLRKIFGR